MIKKKKIRKKFFVKIPEKMTVLYYKPIKLITFVYMSGQTRLIKLKTKIFKISYNSTIKALKISALPFSKVSSNTKKTLKATQGTAVAVIKYLLIELTIGAFSQKMKFVGVGYRAFQIERKKKKLLRLRLGYSHQIYFQFLHKLNFVSFKFTKLFIFGSSYRYVSQFSALIRSCKPPEPYKGKGILYKDEKVLRKIGKRI